VQATRRAPDTAVTACDPVSTVRAVTTVPAVAGRGEQPDVAAVAAMLTRQDTVATVAAVSAKETAIATFATARAVSAAAEQQAAVGAVAGRPLAVFGRVRAVADEPAARTDDRPRRYRRCRESSCRTGTVTLAGT
jgi:hypothetical protein